MADNDSTSTTSPSPITKPPDLRRWADDVPEKPDPPSTSSATDIAATELDSLSINESKKVNNVLNHPEDINIHAVTAGETPYTSAMRFEELNISPELLKGLYVEMKFERSSKIQSISLPMILTPPYKNLIAQAHNGSGKTTCFVLGMLSRADPTLAAPQALCICPTRELAIQNMEVLLKMGKFTGITSELGLPASSSRSGPIEVTAQVIIGTPGTINRWISTKKLKTSKMKILVFDEADHMLAQAGFKDESLKIMKNIVKDSPQCQVLLFSATFDETVKAFVSKIVEDYSVQGYNQLFVKKEELSLDSIKQYKVKIPDEDSKIMVIKDKIMELGQKVGQTIIFVRTRKVLVNLVVNFDLPVRYDSPSEPDCEVYLHRIGRAGRFGRKGAVFNLLCGNRDAVIMGKIKKYYNHYVTEVNSFVFRLFLFDVLL
ncbi:hypothetical protein L6452_21535 [Arctium lappa]|uniref:Uncharacterized protein n=1 Tax=Arctium lappa TaxID=4217 RepID=A0ACB9AXZ8_ARCLA|nr:hypothetical protein L6452_21535 [Arctium lappa]